MAVDNTNFKGCWRPEEDEALRKAVSIHGEKNWSVVARHFNSLMGRSPLLGRAPKQCRSRYLQQLVPGIKTGEWTPEEEEILVEGHRQFGNQWTLIASMLPGRTETSVKNHYNCTARRKVPSDFARMTILQRYLASIGVISASSAGKGAKGFPGLGSGYPSSSSSQFFHNHASSVTRPSSRTGRTTAGSPSVSHQYEEYSDEAARMQQMVSAYQQHTADEDDEEQQQYEQCQQYEQQHQQEQPDMYDELMVDDDVEHAEGAAAGLLQLARAALLHLDAETEEEGGGSHQHKPEPEELVADNESEHQQEVGSIRHLGKHKNSSRQLGVGLFIRSEPVVRSNSEDSAHTAEDEEGSPMAEANLKLQLQQHKPGAMMGKRNPVGSEQVLAGLAGTKRARSMWDQAVPCSGGPLPSGLSRLSRPVLDVSEPHFALPSTLAADASSPANPPAAGAARGISPVATSAVGQQGDAQAQLLAVMMQAFMGAAAAEGATSATHLSPNHLAAVARVMALSGLALGNQGYGGPAAASPANVAHAAVAEMLAALVQRDSPSGVPAAGTPASTWSASSVEQQLRATVGQ